jgi:ornithine cyclodeaminase/alanine dehydrogenase-like protein (mu-crystallin family)
MSVPTGSIRYLDGATVREALPTQNELVDLAALALRSIVGGAEIPERAGLSPGSAGVFAGAMPARLTAAEVAGGGASTDLLGMKWISGGVGNRATGLPALASLIVLNDPGTGAPVAIMDGDAITAARTAALSGVAVRLLVAPRPADPRGGSRHAVLIGAGVQARAHAAMLGALLPGVDLSIHDRHPERAQALALDVAALEGVGEAIAAPNPTGALGQADVVVTATSLTGRPAPGATIEPGDVPPSALVLPVDYAAYVSADLVSSARTFVVDHRGQFEANRRTGRLAGWPDPTATFGELLLDGFGPSDRPSGVAVALHQGPGIADVIVADAVLRRALAAGLGVDLRR